MWLHISFLSLTSDILFLLQCNITWVVAVQPCYIYINRLQNIHESVHRWTWAVKFYTVTSVEWSMDAPLATFRKVSVLFPFSCFRRSQNLQEMRGHWRSHKTEKISLPMTKTPSLRWKIWYVYIMTLNPPKWAISWSYCVALHSFPLHKRHHYHDDWT